MKRLLCGIDIGGTKTEVCLIEFESFDDYRVLSRERIPTDRHLPYETYIQNLALLIIKFTRALPAQSELDFVGIGIPGAVDPHTQIMFQGSIDFLRNKNVKNDLKTALTDISD